MGHYVITRAGRYLAARPGWGPTTTEDVAQARRFPSVSEAYEYRRNHKFFEKYDLARVDPLGRVTPFASR